MSKFDTELLFTTLTDLLKSKLGAKISAINAEKADFEIYPINDDAWYIDELPTTFDYAHFIIYGIASSESTDLSEVAALRTISIDYEVAVPDDGYAGSQNNYLKLLRYARCLEEVFQENLEQIPSYVKLQVDSLLPIQLEVGKKRLDSAGVKVTASITS